MKVFRISAAGPKEARKFLVIAESEQAMRQELVWAKWLPDPEHVCGGRFADIWVPGVPKRIWTLFSHQDKDQKPNLPYAPRHHDNAFLEDRTHDWRPIGPLDSNTKERIRIKYYTRAMDRSCWLLLEYDN